MIASSSRPQKKRINELVRKLAQEKKLSKSFILTELHDRQKTAKRTH